MSVSKWRYNPEICDGDYCPGDCDICSKETGEPSNGFRGGKIPQSFIDECKEFYDYVSPIELKMREEILALEENAIMSKASIAMEVEVDKDELIKAMEYDRGQYDKGFYDGMKAATVIRENAKKSQGSYINRDELYGRFDAAREQGLREGKETISFEAVKAILDGTTYFTAVEEDHGDYICVIGLYMKRKRTQDAEEDDDE